MSPIFILCKTYSNRTLNFNFDKLLDYSIIRSIITDLISDLEKVGQDHSSSVELNKLWVRDEMHC